MDVANRLRTQITSQHLPSPSLSFLTSLTARSPPPPLPSLLATAKARLLACDLTTSDLIDTTQVHAFPPEVLNAANTKEIVLQHDVSIQILDLENLSLSRWEQIEELEAVERGERTQGRQIIRVTDEHDESNGPSSAARSLGPGKNATHRLVLQDRKGARVYAVELQRMGGIGVTSTSIGCKMVIRAGTVVARGTVLMTPENCVVLGGRIDAWHDAWVAGRLKRLKEAVGAGDGNGNGEDASGSR